MSQLNYKPFVRKPLFKAVKWFDSNQPAIISYRDLPKPRKFGHSKCVYYDFSSVNNKEAFRLFCGVVLYVLSGSEFILLRKRELIAFLLN